jgi:hypothetical protein
LTEEIKETVKKMGTNLKKRIEREGEILSKAEPLQEVGRNQEQLSAGKETLH